MTRKDDPLLTGKWGEIDVTYLLIRRRMLGRARVKRKVRPKAKSSRG